MGPWEWWKCILESRDGGRRQISRRGDDRGEARLGRVERGARVSDRKDCLDTAEDYEDAMYDTLLKELTSAKRSKYASTTVRTS